MQTSNDSIWHPVIRLLERPRTETRYHQVVARDGAEGTMLVRAVLMWSGRTGEPVIRPGRSRPEVCRLHQHLLFLLLDGRDRRELGAWLRAALDTSPRAHVVVDVTTCKNRQARTESGDVSPSSADVQHAFRLIDAGDLARAEASIATFRVLARLAARPDADLQAALAWLRFWQGRFEEARAALLAGAVGRRWRLVRGLVAWANGEQSIGGGCDQRAAVSLRALMQAEQALLCGDRAAAVRMLGPPRVSMTLTPLWRAVRDRLHAVASGETAYSLGAAHSVSRMGAHGLWRWGLGRQGMYLIHALAALLQGVNECDDERAVLAAVCRWAREQCSAEAALVVGGDEGRVLGMEGWRRDSLQDGERRAIVEASRPISIGRADGVVVAAPVRYGGARIGSAVVIGPSDRSDTMAEAASAMAAVSGSAVQARLATIATSGMGGALLPEILGRSPSMEAVRAAVARAAPTPFPVLIEGESGTGKELVARALHRLSPRRDRRLAALNCAALSDDLAEAELFGHTRGAFTGAVAPRVGLFEEAHGGTLFLDEVGELSARAQAKLLRALQEREVRRIGENTARAVDVRVVAATNRALSEMTAAGGFRDDLLFRLAVVRVKLPALRDRSEDVPALAQVFWRRVSVEAGKRAVLGADAMARLVCHRWPGNVRELQNVMAGLVVLAPTRGRVGARHVDQVLTASGGRPLAHSCSLACARAEAERRVVAAALARHGGRRAAAARELGITRQGLAKAVRRLRLSAAVDAAEGVA